MKYLLLILPVLALMAMPAFGASSYLGGYSGLLLTPDDVLVPMGGVELSFHDFIDILGNNQDLRTYAVTYGLLPTLEVGASVANSRGSTDLALNGKLSLITETPTRPSVLIGAFDATAMADLVNNDPTFYVVVSKNVTPSASQVAGKPSVPLRLSAGFGSGFLNGFFAGLDWTLVPNLSLMFEYVNGDLGNNNNTVNAGARWAVTRDLRIDAGTIGFDTFAFGLNYRFGPH